MTLTPEWRGRVDSWLQQLETLFYTKLGDVPLEGFETGEQLTPEEASKGDFRSMPTGTEWGAKWQYCWFRGQVTIPGDAAGKRIVLRPEPGGESRSIVNMVEAGGVDHYHKEILLAPEAEPGTHFDILIESYAGHGPTPVGGWPVPYGRVSVPEPPEKQRTVGETSFGIWNEEAFQLWLDAHTLVELRDSNDEDSYLVAAVDEALRQFTLTVDLSLPPDELADSIAAGRKVLRPVLDAHNGTLAPKMSCVGHSHIDVAWLWPLAETERKCARTFATQLALMNEYPEFRFFQSQPHLYEMTRKLYPELYARIKEAIKSGQWIPEGGMWVEADTNISSGESLIRQFLHGKRYFKEELGVESEIMWLPDVFGYSGSMPQIMRGCGINYFSTTKIFWKYNGGEMFPYNTFWWEGIDGTKILSHFHTNYNSYPTPVEMNERWRTRVQKDGIDTRLVAFGWGDGGGGPTRKHLEYIRRQQDLQGTPKTYIESPIDFLRREEAKGSQLPTYVGELYFQAHRGTYTTQAKTKLGNRKSEFALREAETWGAAAAVLAGFAVPAAELDEAWKGVLLNQFHDIIPGSSIHRVYEEAEALYEDVLETARKAADAAAQALLKNNENSLTLFNSLSWNRTELVALPENASGAKANGEALPVQGIDGKTYAEVDLPSCGWKSIELTTSAQQVENTLQAGEQTLENEFLKLTFNSRGEIESCIDKETGRELATEPMNSFRMYKDIPRWFEAWDIDSPYKFEPVEMPAEAQFELVADGPLAAVLRISRKLHKSQMTQEVWLRRGSRRVEFRTVIDWQEKQKLLKVNFPTTIHAEDAVHEIQFGHLKRPTHASRQYDADRFEVAQQKWTALVEENRGAAVLNDCKYGINVEGGSMNLTLLKSPCTPDMTADRGRQEFTYAFCAWNGTFFESDLVQAAYELNVPIFTAPGAAAEKSLFGLDAANVIVDTVKPAEDGSGDVVLRLYEAKHTATACTLTTSLPATSAVQTNMLEAKQSDLPLNDGTIALDFRPFEIKTIRLAMSR